MHFTKFPFVLIMLSVLSIPVMVWAHAAVHESNPKDGAVLGQSPADLSIQFNGPAKLISLTLTGSDEEEHKIDISAATSVDGLVKVALPPLSADTYQVVWRALGVDGHATSGQLGFEVSPAED